VQTHKLLRSHIEAYRNYTKYLGLCPKAPVVKFVNILLLIK